jgi:translocator protein
MRIRETVIRWLRSDNFDCRLFRDGRNRILDHRACPAPMVSLSEQACVDRTPPDGVFAPVWTVLYLTMAIAAWMVWLHRPIRDVAPALGLFALQLVLNVAWSALFFGLHSTAAGLAGIVPLWCAILATVVAFRRVTALAGWILVPYLAWVSFAATLNFAIWRLN